MKRQHSHPMFPMDSFAFHSGMAEWNPDIKMVSGIGSLIICLLSPRCYAALFVGTVMVLMTVYAGKIKWLDYMGCLAIPISFVMLSGIVLLVDVSVDRQGLHLLVTEKSVVQTIRVSAKALTGVTCLYMISLSTPIHEMIGVFRRWHVPQIVIELMYLIYRFLFLLSESYQQMKIAAESRMGFWNLRCSYRTFFGICTNLMITAFRKASKSFDAMEARCYDGEIRFLESEKPMDFGKNLALAVYAVGAVGILWMERM